MKTKLRVVVTVLACCGLVAMLAQSAQEPKKKKKKKEQYSATAMVSTGGAGGSVFQVNLYIDDYTTDEERLQLAQALIEGGSDALRKGMDKMKKGRVSVVGRTGTEVNYIRAWPMENGTRIIMATERPMTFFELRRGTRSRDYEFGIIELVVDGKGRGSGVLIAAAKIKFIEDQQKIEIEHYGIDPVRLTNVRRWD